MPLSGSAWVVFVSGGYTTFWEERGNMPGAAVACRSGLSGPAFVGRLVMRMGEPERSPSFGGELGTRTATPPPPPPPRRVVYVVSGKSDRVGFWSWFGFGVWFLGGKVGCVAPCVFGRKERDSYLVDPASSHMLVSKIKPCMCKYKLFCTVKLRMAH